MANEQNYEWLTHIEDRAEFENELYKLGLTSTENVEIMKLRSQYLWEKYKPADIAAGIRRFRDLWKLLERSGTNGD